jgi:PIN domain nuclease of toxin-antitoxin system
VVGGGVGAIGDRADADQAVNLSSVHRDPFDRLIMATAIVSDCQLASVDQVFPNYPELTGILMRP